ncbi:MAG TPA: hypothetical protein VFB00_05600 [Terriglobales bacterium]|nr:hypothetical protein [Terriglobales bacterium]
MEERIRFITHRGKQILLVDLSQSSPEEVTQISKLVPSYVSSQPRGSVLLLADFTGAKVDKDALTALKEATVYDRPHLKRSAWVGVASLPKVYYENIKSFSRRDLPAFQTREEALEWLVAEEKVASGQ